MEKIITFLLGALTGALLELFITIIFEDKARLWYRRIGRTWKWFVSLIQSRTYPLSKELFQIGKWVTNCVVLEGYGEKYYSTFNIRAQLDSDPLELPKDLYQLKEKISEEQEEIKSIRGHSVFYNGPMVAFVDYGITRTAIYEDPVLYLRFKPTDYYSFLATAMGQKESIPGENGIPTTVYEKYLSRTNYKKPTPFLATSFGVNLSFITNDGYLVIGKRAKGVSHYRDHFQVPVLDAIDGSTIDLNKTAKRGAKEELGIDIQSKDIKIFSLCVDTNLYLYGLTGVVYSDTYSKFDIISRRSIGLKDKWETSELFFIRLDPYEFVSTLKDIGGSSHWYPASFVAIVQCLVNYFGPSPIEEAFNKISPR